MTRIAVKKRQCWQDKKTGDIMWIMGKNGESWNCAFERGRVAHKMTSFTINRYYTLVEK